VNFKIVRLALSLSGRILGPLIFFGFLGYTLDLKFKTQPKITFIALFIAFCLTMLLLAITTKEIMKNSQWKSR
jgi:ABC-type enterochelin transport system permease subunit